MKGKTPKLDRLFKVNPDINMKSICPLQTTAVKYRSFTFYPIELLKVMCDMDQSEWSAEIILCQWLLSTKDVLEHDDDRALFISTYSKIISWLINFLSSHFK